MCNEVAVLKHHDRMNQEQSYSNIPNSLEPTLGSLPMRLPLLGEGIGRYERLSETVQGFGEFGAPMQMGAGQN